MRSDWPSATMTHQPNLMEDMLALLRFVAVVFNPAKMHFDQ